MCKVIAETARDFPMDVVEQYTRNALSSPFLNQTLDEFLLAGVKDEVLTRFTTVRRRPIVKRDLATSAAQSQLSSQIPSGLGQVRLVPVEVWRTARPQLRPDQPLVR